MERKLIFAAFVVAIFTLGTMMGGSWALMRMDQEPAETATVLGQLAAVLTALIAGLAALFAWHELHTHRDTVNTQREMERETLAKSIYGQYLKQAFEHPALARPAIGSVQNVTASDKYYWFVARMLFAGEEIIFVSPNDDIWRDCIKAQISYHAEYCSTDDFQQRQKAFYSPEIVELIDEVVQSHREGKGGLESAA